MNPLHARYPEAFEYLRARGVEPSADFYDRVEAARKQAWTMSKLSDLDHIQRIKDSLEKAIAEGTSFDNWRKANLADLQGLPKSYQETVFRTAVQSSYNAGRWAHFRDHAERRPILRYTAINDSRTRPAHRALHGLMMPVDDPRWQTLAPPGGFNCFLPGTTVRGAFELGLKSRYTGEAIEITAGTGDRLAVTANHPVLTRRGWLPAHQIKEGDYLLAYSGVVNPLLARVFNNQYPPAPVEDVFEALRADGFGIADIAAFQFHGDTHLRESEVHVAGRNAHLIARMQTAGVHGIKQFHLVGAGARFPGQLAGDGAAQPDVLHGAFFTQNTAHVAARTTNSLCHATLAAAKHLAVFLKDAFTQGARLFTRRIPRGGQLALRAAGSGFDGEPLDGLRFALTAPCNTMRQQTLADNLTADTVALGETVFTLPGNIGFDDAVYHRIRQEVAGFAETAVVGVRRFHYSGHAYDFQTKNGLIVAGNIVVHNCRCTLMSLSERQAKGMGYTGAPQNIPTWTDKHGVEHTAAPDKGWNHSPEHDLTDLLREREQKAGVAPAQYSEPVKEKNPIFETSRSITEEGERIYAQYRHVVDEAIARGAPHEGILEILKREGVEVGATVRVTGTDGGAVREITEALKKYPADWVEKSNAAGITIIHNDENRAFARTYPKMTGELLEEVRKTRVQTHKPLKESLQAGAFKEGDLVTLVVRDTRKGISQERRMATHVHEFGHRLQEIMPEMDALFTRLWQERTKDDKVEKLRELFPNYNYEKGEKTKKDHFPDPYWGKMYGTKDDPQPREMLTMAFQSLVGGEEKRFNELFNDKELFYFVLSVFTRYRA